MLALAFACYELWKDNAKLQQQRIDDVQQLQAQRVSDTQAVTQQLIKINNDCIQVFSTVAASMDAHKEAMAEMKAAFRDMRDSIAELQPRSRR